MNSYNNSCSYTMSLGRYHDSVPSLPLINTIIPVQGFCRLHSLFLQASYIKTMGFDGLTGPESFLDQITNLKKFFNFHKLSDSYYIFHANMSLVKSARCYWKSLLRDIDRLGQHLITLSDEIKRVLSNKYTVVYYRTHLLDQFFLHLRHHCQR